MARALCAMGDTTRQKILTCPPRSGVRMRACPGVLQIVSISHLRRHGASGPGGGLLEANAVRLPSGLSSSRLFLFFVIIVHGAARPRPPGISIADARPRRRAAHSRRARAIARFGDAGELPFPAMSLAICVAPRVAFCRA